MPELPEVEAVCRKLREDALGATITGVRVLRPAAIAPLKPAELKRRVTGARISGVERRGKNILVRLSTGDVIHVHLRMTGNFYTVDGERERPPLTRIMFTLSGGRAIVFEDSRALGRLRVYSSAELASVLAGLGPEPLSPDFAFPVFLAAARASRAPAKLFLLDQRRVAGLGNIWAAEALFRARVNPARPLRRMSASKLRGLHRAIVALLRRAVQFAYITYIRPGRLIEADSFPLAVYGREGEPCPRCRRPVRRFTQGGRSTYYCPGCQR